MFYCSELARSENDQLFGTAKNIRLFFVLEYWQAWQRKALECELLSAEVRAFIKAISKQVSTRFVLVRRPESRERRPSCWIALPGRGGSPGLVYRRQLDEYRDVLDIPVLDLIKGNRTSEIEVSNEPMFLVCSHGKRDKCCAKFGNPIAQQLAAADAAVWESTHLGGCRFAANMLCLPDGLLYGQLSAETARLAIDRYREGSIVLENFRGRSEYTKPVQAAEFFVRHQYGWRKTDEIQLHETVPAATEAASASSWITTFAHAGNGGTQYYDVQHWSKASAEPRIVACSEQEEPELIWSNYLTSIRVR
jgi:hypothetical protein